MKEITKRCEGIILILILHKKPLTLVEVSTKTAEFQCLCFLFVLLTTRSVTKTPPFFCVTLKGNELDIASLCIRSYLHSCFKTANRTIDSSTLVCKLRTPQPWRKRASCSDVILFKNSVYCHYSGKYWCEVYKQCGYKIVYSFYINDDEYKSARFAVLISSTLFRTSAMKLISGANFI